MKSILDIWKEEEGLVTIQFAAELLKIKQPSVSVAVDKNKIKSFEFGKKRYLSFKDVLFYKASREQKNREKGNKDFG